MLYKFIDNQIHLSRIKQKVSVIINYLKNSKAQSLTKMKQKLLKSIMNENKRHLRNQVQIQDFKPVTLILNRIKKSQNTITEFDNQDSQSRRKFQFQSINEIQENSWRNGQRNQYQQIGRKVKTQYQMPKRNNHEVDEIQDEHSEQSEHSDDYENQEQQGSEELINELCQLIKHKKIKGQMSQQLNSRVKRVLQAANVVIPSRSPLSQIQIPNLNLNLIKQNKNIKESKNNRIQTQASAQQQLFSQINLQKAAKTSKNPSQYIKTNYSQQQNFLNNNQHFNNNKNSDNYPQLWNTFNGKSNLKIIDQEVLNRKRKSQSVDKRSIGKIGHKNDKQSGMIKKQKEKEKQYNQQKGGCKKRVLSYAVQLAENNKSKSKEKKKICNKQVTCKNSSSTKLQNQLGTNSNRHQSKVNENKSKSKQKLVHVSKNQKKIVTKLIKQRNSTSRNKSNGKLSSHLSTGKLKTLQSSFKINRNGSDNRKIYTEQADPMFDQIGSDEQLFDRPKHERQSTSATLHLHTHPDTPQFFQNIQILQQKKSTQQNNLQSLISTLKHGILTQRSLISQKSQSNIQLSRQIKSIQVNQQCLKNKKKDLHKKLQIVWNQVKNINGKVMETKKQNQRVLGMLAEEKELIEMYETVIDQIKQQLKIEMDAKDEYKKMVALSKKNENASRIKANFTKQKTQNMLENVRTSINKWIK